MRLRLLEYVRCPTCLGRLRFEDDAAWSHDGVEQGGLSCAACGRRYRIDEGYPRFSEPGDGWASDVMARTAQGYGYLWSRSTVAAAAGPYHWEQMAQGLGLPLPQGLVLDAGCGDGIDLANQARRSQVEIIGVELSDGGCRTSAARCRELPAAAVLQGDVARLPFADDTFDFIYSYGVLHHLPSPLDGLRELVRVLKPGAQVALYLYEDFRERPRLWRWLLDSANACRDVTTTLPPALLYRLCQVGSPVAYAAFTVPYRVLSRIPAARSFSAAIPYRHGTGPFSLVGDLYDRFSAPIERRYTREAALAFVRDGGLEEVRIVNDRGWMIAGRKPTGVA